MKKRFILNILAIAISTVAFAQMTTGLDKDSLHTILAAMPADTLKVYSLITLGQQYENNTPDSALYYYAKARDLSNQLHFPRGFIKYAANYTAVLNFQGRFDESLKINKASLDTARKYNMRRETAKALGNIGAAYQYKEDYQSAADYYLQALPIFDESELQQLSVLCGNLSGLYRNLRQTDKANTYARRAVEYAEKEHDPPSMASAYNNLANVLKDQGRIDEAITWLNKAFTVAREVDDFNNQETALVNLGDAYNKQKKFPRAIDALLRALPLSKQLGDVVGQSFSLQGIAIGLFRQHQYEEARRQVITSIDFARAHDQKENLSNGLLLMSDILTATGHLDEAEHYRDQYDSVTNSLLNASTVKNIQELETKYQVEKNQREVLQKNLELEQKSRESLRQRNVLYGLTAGAIILILLLVLGYRAYRSRQQLNNKEMETLRSEQENIRLKALLDGQSQERRRISREIHDDIGSGLTSLVFLSREIPDQYEASVKIRTNARDLTKKMNEIIWTMSEEEDNLEGLLSYIRVNVAHALDNAHIDYRFDIVDPIPDIKLPQEWRRNVYLIAKEAVHNIVRHAEAREVLICMQAGEKLGIIIHDDGKGLPAGEGEGRRFGNGLKNMRRRAADIHGELTIRSREGQKGTRLELTVPWPV